MELIKRGDQGSLGFLRAGRAFTSRRVPCTHTLPATFFSVSLLSISFLWAHIEHLPAAAAPLLTAEQAKKELGEIKLQLQANEQELRALAKERREISELQEKIRSELVEIENSVVSLEGDQSELAQKRGRLMEKREKQHIAVSSLEDKVRARTRAFIALNRYPVFFELIEGHTTVNLSREKARADGADGGATDSSSAELFRAAQAKLARQEAVLGRIFQKEAQNLDATVGELREMLSEEEILNNEISRLEREIERLQSSEGELKQQDSEQLRVSAEIQKKEAQVIEIRERLTQQLVVIEASLSSLMGGKGVAPRVSQKREEVIEQARIEPETERGIQQEIQSSVRLGNLPYPVSGRIVGKFGRHTHEQFGNKLFRNGVEFETAAGEAVKAVEKGKVIATDSLPLFGNVVIVDHGERFYTLYGRLGEVRCAVGESVAQGQSIGTVSEDGASEAKTASGFYFEVRKKGVPIDPAPFFASR